jgi:hypothetical protein
MSTTKTCINFLEKNISLSYFISLVGEAKARQFIDANADFGAHPTKIIHVFNCDEVDPIVNRSDALIIVRTVEDILIAQDELVANIVQLQRKVANAFAKTGVAKVPLIILIKDDLDHAKATRRLVGAGASPAHLYVC